MAAAKLKKYNCSNWEKQFYKTELSQYINYFLLLLDISFELV